MKYFEWLWCLFRGRRSTQSKHATCEHFFILCHDNAINMDGPRKYFGRCIKCGKQIPCTDYELARRL